MNKFRYFGPYFSKLAAAAQPSMSNNLLCGLSQVRVQQQKFYPAPVARRFRDLFPESARTLTEQQTGVVGEKSFKIGDEEDEEAEDRNFKWFPDLETFNSEFYGQKFEEIPICLIRCSKNNTKIGFTTPKGADICYTSSSQEGFKNAKKKSLVAGQATGVAAAIRALRRGVKTVRVQIKGLGPGRLSSVKGLTLGGLNIVCIQDVTPLPEYGPRPKKVRRL